ncbi:nucleoporin Nup120/160-domain-containing protein [Phyllosticta citriasiana]|uniref:Nucleoporin Nup120/160-domain-containing protein n=1 Tax=Phyllosticta citriasiana TaxID=595635 RepID=A0ABR1KHC1_9PEZI
MATSVAPLLHRETRLNLDPSYAGTTIGFILPSHGNSSFLSRSKGTRRVLQDHYQGSDETGFVRQHLAAGESSIFFRQKHTHPRSFLWRILSERKILELRSVDLTVDKHQKGEAILTLLLEFPNPIQPFGVALAEPAEKDSLNVFVLTIARELYTLDLPKDFFIRPAASEVEADIWCKSCIPSAFTLRTPYRLVAPSAQELLISLEDGLLLRLTRNAADDGSSWRETFYGEGGFGSALKSFLPWKGSRTIRFGDRDLQASTAAAIEHSPDQQHIWTVSLNHTLRSWNVKNGRVGLETDLLGENNRDPQNMAPFFVGAEQRKLMQILEVQAPRDGDEYFIVTYSPKRHQFKFWGVRDADYQGHGIHDVQPDFVFTPPVDELMNTTVWNLEEFCIKPKSGWRDADLWIQVRSGPRCSVFNLRFSLYDDLEQLEDTWRNNWTTVDAGSLTADSLKATPSNPRDLDMEDPSFHSRSVTEKYLEFLFYPGRFTIPTLEAALGVYLRGLSDESMRLYTAAGKMSLKEKISIAVAVKVQRRQGSDGLDHDKQELDLANQWQVFYGVVEDFHKRRGEPIGLVYDFDNSLPWLLHADYVSPIRTCSEVEILRLNEDKFAGSEDPPLSRPLFSSLQDDLSINVAKLLTAAAVFRKSFPSSFNYQLELAVRREVAQESSFSILDRMAQFEAYCSICDQVTDDDFEKLSSHLDDLGGFQGITQELVVAALERLDESTRGHSQLKAIAGYGAKTLIRGAQETLELTYEILLDLLVLIAFVGTDFENPQESLPDLDVAEIYPVLIERLKGALITRWLARTVRADPQKTRRRSSSVTSEMDIGENPVKKCTATVTIFESLFIGDWATMRTPDGTLPELITYWCRAWTFGLPLPESWEFVSGGVMSNLLKHGNIDLASEFLPFLPSNVWGTYLRARYYLAIGKDEMASIYFNKASYGCGFFDIFNVDTYGFLNAEERDSFRRGLGPFCHHVMNLFDRAKSHVFVVQWAEQALMYQEAASHPKSIQEILSRLFHASVACSNFRSAYGALIRYEDVRLRKASLASLVKAMVTQHREKALIALPFSHDLDAVDEVLASLARDALNVASGPGESYHRTLYAFRVAKNNYRGAAHALYDQISRLKASATALHDPKDARIVNLFLVLINTLALVKDDDRYLLVGQRESTSADGVGLAKQVVKRRILTLDDIRREYQDELDRVAAMETGRFAFGMAAAGDGDVDML